jgi:hypothetical protein
MMEAVQVTMTREEVARKWAIENALCLIDWNTLNSLVNCYQKQNGIGSIIMHQDGLTYKLPDDRAAIAAGLPKVNGG